jgi:hypothetical protein
MADLGAALAVNPSDVDALLLRAEVHRAAGSQERCFLDLRAVSILAPAVSVLVHVQNEVEHLCPCVCPAD